MAEFIGTHTHTLDDKGRVSVPAQFRRQLTAEEMYLNLGLDGCLVLYPSEIWRRVEEKLLSLPHNKETRFLIRSRAQNLRAVSLDSQGRISIPSELLRKAGIAGEVMFLGRFDTIELWQPERYHSYVDEAEFSSEEIAGKYDIPL